jgi:hypothetical protein
MIRWKDAVDVTIVSFQTIACSVYHFMFTISDTSNIPNWNHIILHPETTVNSKC